LSDQTTFDTNLNDRYWLKKQNNQYEHISK
jgi:hypothetical protein